MIGRADIEGSKSNVAMNAWLPQASSLIPLSTGYLPPASLSFLLLGFVQPVDKNTISGGSSPYLKPANQPNQLINLVSSRPTS